MTTRVLVSGAGIGGLSAGLALKRAGFDVKIFERHPELRTAGAGLNVWPNGVRVLYDLGLKEAFDSTANLLEFYRTYSSDGELIGEEDLVAYRTRYGAPVTGVYRRDLSAMLAAPFSDTELMFDHEITSYEERDDKVIVHFAHGGTETGDLLIAADGVYSAIRHQMIGEVEFKTDKHVRWRGIFQVADAGIHPKSEVDVIGEHGHLGWLPIGRGLAYWYAAGEGLETKEQALAYFGSWQGSLVPQVLRATDPDSIIRNELMDFATPLKSWTTGRVALLGDSAHPMLPGVAQGANQALEDSAIITRHLLEAPNYQTAFERYEAERIELVNRVVVVARSLFAYDEKLDEFHEAHANPIFRHYARIVENQAAA